MAIERIAEAFLHAPNMEIGGEDSNLLRAFGINEHETQAAALWAARKIFPDFPSNDNPEMSFMAGFIMGVTVAARLAVMPISTDQFDEMTREDGENGPQ